MKTETIKVYIAEDGERFKDERECRDYEINLHKMETIQNMYLYPLPENIVEGAQFEDGLCFIQHKQEWFEQYKESVFEEICLEYLFNIMTVPFANKEKTKVAWNEYNLFRDKVWYTDMTGSESICRTDSLEYVVNYFDKKIQEPFIDAWRRVINTDQYYREWRFRVYAYKSHDDIEPFALNR